MKNILTKMFRNWSIIHTVQLTLPKACISPTTTQDSWVPKSIQFFLFFKVNFFDISTKTKHPRRNISPKKNEKTPRWNFPTPRQKLRIHPKSETFHPRFICRSVSNREIYLDLDINDIHLIHQEIHHTFNVLTHAEVLSCSISNIVSSSVFYVCALFRMMNFMYLAVRINTSINKCLWSRLNYQMLYD